MTRVVVDASVVFSSLIANGRSRAILLGSHSLEFYVPAIITQEVRRHFPEACEKANLPRTVVEGLLEDVLASLQVVPDELLRSALDSARARCRSAHALNDDLYVALADVLDAPIWSYDKDFRRVSGVRVVSVRELLDIIDRRDR